MSEDFLAALSEDFQQHGSSVIQQVRAEKPADYLRVIASVIPKDLIVNPSSLEDMGDDELMENPAIVRGLAGKLGLPGTGSGSGGSSSMN